MDGQIPPRYLGKLRVVSMFGKRACTIPAALWLVGACSVYDPSLLSTNQGVGEGGAIGTGGGGTSAPGGGTAGGPSGGAAGRGTGGATTAGAGGMATAAGAGGALAGAGGSGGIPSAGGSTVLAAAGAGGNLGSAAGFGGNAGGGALALDLIDDMEDDDAVINYEDGRNGDWYVGHDATASGTQFPGTAFMMSALDTTDSRYAVSKFAAMTKGMGFTDWGENMGFNIKLVNQTLGKHPPYDASAYCGLHFYGRVGPGVSSEVIFRVPDKNSHPDGGVCSTQPGAAKPCYIPYQKLITFTTDWKEYSILFTDLTRSGWGPVPFEVSAIYGVEFGLLPSTKFELWIDDISFFVKPASGACPTKL